MSKFEKLKQLKIGNYFRELSVVIIGVAVTLYASNAITNAKEQKDLNIQLNAIYAELEYNLQRVNDLIDFYDDVEQLRKYITEDYYNPGQVDGDSIRKYTFVIGRIREFVYKKGAYEMFLNSGAAKLFKDKTLLSDIAECYIMMEGAKNSVNTYMTMKMDVMKKLYDFDTKMIMDDIDLKHPMYLSLYNFHLTVSGGGEDLQETKELIEKVLAK
jgi:hypothetical protein